MITSRSNPLIRAARALRQTRARKEAGLFLIEGLQQVRAAIDAGWEIEALLHAPELLTSQVGTELISRFGGRNEEVSTAVFKYIAEKENPQGILAIGRRREVRLGGFAPMGFSAAVVCPQDPGNVGTILRTLDAVGGSGLYLLDGGVDPYHPTAIRASMGASFILPIVETSFEELANWCRQNGLQLVGTSARGKADYRDVTPKVPWILVLGSEQKGLSETQKQACDIIVAVPMRGRGTSLNLAVAAGILLYAFTRGR